MGGRRHDKHHAGSKRGGVYAGPCLLLELAASSSGLLQPETTVPSGSNASRLALVGASQLDTVSARSLTHVLGWALDASFTISTHGKRHRVASQFRSFEIFFLVEVQRLPLRSRRIPWFEIC